MRPLRTIIFGMLVVLVLVATIIAAPKLISYQGKATDAAGQPVTDGSHPAVFQIYDKNNNQLWSEAATVTTSSGLFTHNLGSVTPLDAWWFLQRDTLYLQVTFEGQIQTPRTLFTAAPYAQVAGYTNSIDQAKGGSVLDQLTIFGYDAQGDVIELNTAAGGGTIGLRDIDNMLQLKLDANDRSLAFIDAATGVTTKITSEGSDGKIRIDGPVYFDGTEGSCYFYPDSTGPLAVGLPNGCITKYEINDEPGIVQRVAPSININLTTSNFVDIMGVSTTPPTIAGYYLVTGSIRVYLQGTEKVDGYFQIYEAGESNPSLSDPTISKVSLAGGSSIDVNVSRVYENVFSSTRTFKIRGAKVGGTAVEVDHGVLRALYIPTSYGTVETIVSSQDAANFENAERIEVDGQTMYKVDLRELELRAAKAEAEAERAKRELLEAQMKK